MKSRAASYIVIIASLATLAWILPKWIIAGASARAQIVRPSHDDAPPQPTDPRVAPAIRALVTLPSVPAIGARSARAAVINGLPVVNCVFLAHGVCADIMDYYLSQLAVRGWTDITERYLNIDSKTSEGGDDQSMQEALHYDHLRSTQAALVKDGRTLSISLEPKPLGRCLVSLTAAETPDLAGFWHSTLEHSAAVANKKGANVWLETSAAVSGGNAKTRFYSGKGTPAEMIAQIAGEMSADGWRVMLPPPEPAAASKSCLFLKPGRWAVATARNDSKKGGATAVLAIQ